MARHAPSIHGIFLSHSAKDKPTARALAERLRKDGLKVWFDESILNEVPLAHRMGEGAPGAGEGRLSAHAFDPDRAQWESRRCGRDNWRERRLDDTPLSASTGERAGVRCRIHSQHVAMFNYLKPEAREILNELLEKYAADGALQFVLPDVPKVPPISQHGSVGEIVNVFGGPDELRSAVNQLQELLYAY